MSSGYRGRFAPSPTGLLHQGSLTCALASYLDAKANNGCWLLRIDDIDPPREQPGASENIIYCLQAHGLYSDEIVVMQSKNSERYQRVLEYFEEKQLSYRCDCTRKRLRTLEDGYDGHCRARNLSDKYSTSVRLNIEKSLHFLEQSKTIVSVTDQIQGKLDLRFNQDGDFIIHRKDGLFAYQLAVVVEDNAQGITHIVRGTDLLDTTAKHYLLSRLLCAPMVNFCHIPTVIGQNGKKLSKQNHAPIIDNQHAKKNVYKALQFLQQNPPLALQSKTIDDILNWAIAHWNINALKHLEEIQV